jgi:hypothetical protein
MEHGEDSLVYVTSILAQFYASHKDVLIPEELLKYPTPPHDTYNLQPAAGLDLAFSAEGDKTHFCIWHGNMELYRSTIQTENADALHSWIIDQLTLGSTRYGLLYENCYADGGGIGAPIISRVVEAGYHITTRRNEFSAFNKDYYLNLGAEMWFRVKRLIQQKILILPNDQLAIKQLTERRAILNETTQKWRLEPKHEAKKRLRYSPDRADSIVLALSGYPLDIMLARPPQAAQNALHRGTTAAELARQLADYAFDNVNRDAKSRRNAVYGLNHATLLKYAKR